MFIRLNFKSGLPVYLQIVEQVKAAAASGALRPGEAIPSIRPLAEELRVNRNTIAKAYAELENEGIIETHPGRGSFVSQNHTPLKREVCRKLVSQAIDAALVQAHHFQISPDEFLELASRRADEFKKQQSAHASEPHENTTPRH